jgi:hypothetical protein
MMKGGLDVTLIFFSSMTDFVDPTAGQILDQQTEVSQLLSGVVKVFNWCKCSSGTTKKRVRRRGRKQGETEEGKEKRKKKEK